MVSEPPAPCAPASRISPWACWTECASLRRRGLVGATHLQASPVTSLSTAWTTPPVQLGGGQRHSPQPLRAMGTAAGAGSAASLDEQADEALEKVQKAMTDWADGNSSGLRGQAAAQRVSSFLERCQMHGRTGGSAFYSALIGSCVDCGEVATGRYAVLCSRHSGQVLECLPGLRRAMSSPVANSNSRTGRPVPLRAANAVHMCIES